VLFRGRGLFELVVACFVVEHIHDDRDNGTDGINGDELRIEHRVALPSRPRRQSV